MEIERKFKVLELPKDLESYEKEEIEQGYLCIKPTVRIRKSNDNYFLNYKWKNKNIKITILQKSQNGGGNYLCLKGKYMTDYWNGKKNLREEQHYWLKVQGVWENLQ